MVDVTALGNQLAQGKITPADMACELRKVVLAQGGHMPTTIASIRAQVENMQRAADLWKAVLGGLEALEDEV